MSGSISLIRVKLIKTCHHKVQLTRQSWPFKAMVRSGYLTLYDDYSAIIGDPRLRCISITNQSARFLLIFDFVALVLPCQVFHFMEREVMLLRQSLAGFVAHNTQHGLCYDQQLSSWKQKGQTSRVWAAEIWAVSTVAKAIHFWCCGIFLPILRS